MRIALEEAKKAFNEDEVPVGACLVRDDKLILKNHNRTKQLKNPMAHAEALILNEIHKKGINYLYDYKLYVTLEPCVMCSGMIVLSRIGELVFGCFDEKGGASGSVYNILKNKYINHHPKIRFGILENETSAIIKNFFLIKRKR